MKYFIGDPLFGEMYDDYDTAVAAYEEYIEKSIPQQVEVMQIQLEDPAWQYYPAEVEYKWLLMANKNPEKIKDYADGLLRETTLFGKYPEPED